MTWEAGITYNVSSKLQADAGDAGLYSPTPKIIITTKYMFQYADRLTNCKGWHRYGSNYNLKIKISDAILVLSIIHKIKGSFKAIQGFKIKVGIPEISGQAAASLLCFYYSMGSDAGLVHKDYLLPVIHLPVT